MQPTNQPQPTNNKQPASQASAPMPTPAVQDNISNPIATTTSPIIADNIASSNLNAQPPAQPLKNTPVNLSGKQTKPNDTPKATLNISQVRDKISNANNILIALEKTANIDELASAIGLVTHLDSINKHATAIFSGRTPEVLDILDLSTLEKNTNSLRDFIISLAKEKADHLRYKVDGDYVRVFISPYRTVIDQSDLEFSHGDYNVDLVVGINISSLDNLDAALYDFSKIKSKAEVINISTRDNSNFGSAIFFDSKRSSISEILIELISGSKGDLNRLNKDSATAFLLGLMGATDRFANLKTKATTMSAAAIAMAAGADQPKVANRFKLFDRENDGVENLSIQNQPEDEIDIKQEEQPKDETEPSDNEENNNEGLELNSGDIEKKSILMPEAKTQEIEEEPEDDLLKILASDAAMRQKGAAGDITDELKLMPEYVKENEAKEEPEEKQPKKTSTIQPIGVSISPDRDYAKMIEDALSEASTPSLTPAPDSVSALANNQDAVQPAIDAPNEAKAPGLVMPDSPTMPTPVNIPTPPPIDFDNPVLPPVVTPTEMVSDQLNLDQSSSTPQPSIQNDAPSVSQQPTATPTPVSTPDPKAFQIPGV